MCMRENKSCYLNHLVHSTRAKTRSHSIRDCFGGDNVRVSHARRLILVLNTCGVRKKMMDTLKVASFAAGAAALAAMSEINLLQFWLFVQTASHPPIKAITRTMIASDPIALENSLQIMRKTKKSFQDQRHTAELWNIFQRNFFGVFTL